MRLGWLGGRRHRGRAHRGAAAARHLHRLIRFGHFVCFAETCAERPGDALLAVLSTRGSPDISAPAGWRVVRVDHLSSTLTEASYVKMAGTGEPSSYVFTLSKAEAVAGAVLAYGGVDATTPVDAAAGAAQTSNSTKLSAPSVQTSAAGEKVLALFSTLPAVKVSPPSGEREEVELSSSGGNYQVTLEVADVTLSNAGSTGTAAASSSAAHPSLGQRIALRSAKGSAPVDAGTPPTHDAGTPPMHDAGTPPVTDAGTPPVTDALYVSLDGSDSNSGSASAPFRHLAKGMASLKAGRTLYVHGGTYLENVSLSPSAGTASSPVTVRNYPGERPVLQGLLWLNAPSYWKLDGINVTWNSSNSADQHMVKISGGKGWELVNCELWGAHSYANLLVADDADAFWIHQSYIHDNYGSPSHSAVQDHDIYLHMTDVNASGLIERNILANAPRGEAIKMDGVGDGSGGGMNITFRYNTVVNASRATLFGGQTHDLDHYRNIMVPGGVGADIALYSYQCSGKNNRVHEDLFFDYGTLYKVSGGSGGLTTSNNLEGTVNPQLDSSFHPQNSAAQAYGRFAP